MARDSSVVRLFVEYSLLDLPTEETPVSLPKPPQGKSINFNYSKGKDLDLDTLFIPLGTAAVDDSADRRNRELNH